MLRATTACLATALLTCLARPAAAQLLGFGQSFTAPVDASYLQAVRTGALSGSTANGGTLAFGLRPWNGSTLVGPSLFTTTPTSQSIAPNLRLDVGVELTPGSAYLFLLVLTGDGFLTSGPTDAPDVLPGGAWVLCLGATRCSGPGTSDVQDFAPIFIAAPTTVPEPSTWALLGTGLLTLGGIAAHGRTRTRS